MNAGLSRFGRVMIAAVSAWTAIHAADLSSAPVGRGEPPDTAGPVSELAVRAFAAAPGFDRALERPGCGTGAASVAEPAHDSASEPAGGGSDDAPTAEPPPRAIALEQA